jgi:hypothetical protein
VLDRSVTRALFILVSIVSAACSSPPVPTVTASPAAASPVAIAPASPPSTPTPTGGLTTPAPSTAPVRTPAPTPSLDPRTAALIARLDEWCAPPFGSTEVLFALLGQLADGRSAFELVDVLSRSRCQLQPRAYGDGATEVVTAGAYREVGALLWVDRGFWLIAPVPTEFGYLKLISDHPIDGRRELVFAIDSGGSAGDKGFLGVEIVGRSARLTLDTAPSGASQVTARFVSDQLLLIVGRKLPSRPWGISSNCCLPGGHEWLWRSTSTGYVLVAERQAQDSYFALNALLGALDAGELIRASDVATSAAVKEAIVLFGGGRSWNYRGSPNAHDQDQAELLRWTALPSPSTLPPETVTYEVARAEPRGPSALITFERIGGFWIATSVKPGTLP